MLEDKDYKILKMHICSFERKNGILTFDMEKYPERLCVFDKNKKIVIDVETWHKYPYIRVLNGQSFYDITDVKMLTPNNRVACMEYATFIHDLEKDVLEKCQKVIKLLQKGHEFPNGNEMLSNEDYLKFINNKENNVKTKKIGRKRK